MSWHAIEAVDDALTATRRFLFPFEFGTWLRLAVIAFFLGGAGAPTNVFNYSGGSGGMPDQIPGVVSDIPLPDVVVPDLAPPFDGIWGLIALVLLVTIAIGLVFGLIGAIMQFVLVDAVTSREVHIRRYFRGRLGKGLQLFAFQLVIWLLIAAMVVATLAPIFLTGGGPAIWLFVLAIPVFLVLTLFVSLILQLTTDFVVPVMIARDANIFAGWQAFWPTLRTNLAQVGLYVVVRWVLGLGVGIVVGFVTGIIGLVFLLIVGVPVAGALAAGIGTGPLVLVLGALFGALALLAFLLALAFVQAPVQTYFRYYALLVLADLNVEFDLLGEFGREVREESTSG